MTFFALPRLDSPFIKVLLFVFLVPAGPVGWLLLWMILKAIKARTVKSIPSAEAT